MRARARAYDARNRGINVTRSPGNSKFCAIRESDSLLPVLSTCNDDDDDDARLVMRVLSHVKIYESSSKPSS